MSTRRGANLRDRPQKYKNRTAFKNDLHDKTPQIKFLNSLQISEVCEHCKSVIEWKIKYKKYKPLSQPKKCTKCGERNVRKAYHVNCTDCALKLRCCAKCNVSADAAHILPPAPTPQEQMKLDSEMQLLIKKLPERKRRTFLRYMKRGKKKEREEGDDKSDDDDDSNADGIANGGGAEEDASGEALEKKKEETIPYTKEELLEKLERMKLALEDDEEDFDDEFFDEFDDDDEDDDEGAEFDDEEEDELSSDEDKNDVKVVVNGKANGGGKK